MIHPMTDKEILDYLYKKVKSLNDDVSKLQVEVQFLRDGADLKARVEELEKGKPERSERWDAVDLQKELAAIRGMQIVRDAKRVYDLPSGDHVTVVKVKSRRFKLDTDSRFLIYRNWRYTENEDREAEDARKKGHAVFRMVAAHSADDQIGQIYMDTPEKPLRLDEGMVRIGWWISPDPGQPDIFRERAAKELRQYAFFSRGDGLKFTVYDSSWRAKECRYGVYDDETLKELCGVNDDEELAALEAIG